MHLAISGTDVLSDHLCYETAMVIDVEFEIRDLKRRVGELEGSFGFLIEQLKGVHRDLIGFQAETRERLDRVESEVGGLRGEVGGLRGEVRQLREDMPGIVGDAMREVLRSRNGGMQGDS